MSAYARALTHRPVNYVDGALRFAFPHKVAPSDRLVVNILAYFDESGTHRDSPSFAFAGFLGRPDDWGAFTYLWQKALDEFGIEAFHMADFESRKDPFTEENGWTEPVRRKRLTRLLALIQAYALGSVGVVMPMALYNEFFPAGPARTRPGGPYGIAAQAMFIEVGELARPLSGDPWVAYTFERGAVGAGQVLKNFQDNLKDVNVARPLRLDSLTFQNKRDFLPLQAADILAYELYKELPRALSENIRPSRYPLRVLATLPRRWTRLTEENLKNYREVIDLGLVHSTGTWHLPPGASPKVKRSPRKSTHGR